MLKHMSKTVIQRTVQQSTPVQQSTLSASSRSVLSASSSIVLRNAVRSVSSGADSSEAAKRNQNKRIRRNQNWSVVHNHPLNSRKFSRVLDNQIRNLNSSSSYNRKTNGGRVRSPGVSPSSSQQQRNVHIDRGDLIRKSSAKITQIYEPTNKQLGEGGFGAVSVCNHRITGEQRAAKRIPKENLRGEWEMLENEVKAMIELDHPNICKLYEYFIDEDAVFLILELLDGPDLFDHMLERFEDDEKQNRFNEYEAGVLARQMLKSVFCCHSMGVTHRDIKPENFMFSQGALKMIDLGLADRTSSKLPEGATAKDVKDLDNESSKTGKMTEVTGTLSYMAPEMLNAKGYTRQCDIWSVGVIAYMMLSGRPLFSLVDDRVAQKQIGDHMWVKKELRRLKRGCSREGFDFLLGMLERNPDRRFTAKEALEHPFIMRTYMIEDNANQKDGKDELMTMEQILDKMRLFAELPILKRTALIVLAHMVGTSSDELNNQRRSFLRLDEDGSGSVSLEEFIHGVEREKGKIPDDFKDFIWTNVDLNESGDINFTEFMAACLCGDQHFTENHWKGVFQVLDANGSDRLDIEDLEELFPSMQKSEIELMLKEVVPHQMYFSCDSFVQMMLEESEKMKQKTQTK